jgi:hypothetical protein
LVISDVLANIVPAEEASEEGLQGNGVSVLRINLIGETGSELVGYNNDTNKLGECLEARVTELRAANLF